MPDFFYRQMLLLIVSLTASCFEGIHVPRAASSFGEVHVYSVCYVLIPHFNWLASTPPFLYNANITAPFNTIMSFCVTEKCVSLSVQLKKKEKFQRYHDQIVIRTNINTFSYLHIFKVSAVLTSKLYVINLIISVWWPGCLHSGLTYTQYCQSIMYIYISHLVWHSPPV